MNKFHLLDSDVPEPSRFTFPFNYTPHPLCVIAAKEVHQQLADTEEWHPEIDEGKMFGVLVVRDSTNRLGFLAAYSGLLCGRNDWPYFVPPVYDSQQPDGIFKLREREISKLNKEIHALENAPQLIELRHQVMAIETDAEKEIADYKAFMQTAKMKRDELRHSAGPLPADKESELIRESQFQKAELRRIKLRCKEQISAMRNSLAQATATIRQKKERRREMSESLQQWLFSQYNLLNAKGETCNLCTIFSNTPQGVPPSGAGDCCAPKLLQYAYLSGMHPVCMAEFWWGKSPKSEIRHHLHFYPACRSKCKPILGFMLQGLAVDPNPHDSITSTDELKIIYQDESIIVVDKPSGMLSMPGLVESKSVVDALHEIYGPEAYLMPAHRLDMDTSGLLVVARSERALRNLHEQFAAHTVEKRYSAVLCGEANALQRRGTIRLPLSADASDRPRQVVDHSNGKPAVTDYEIVRIADGKTYIKLYPHTGRTHQLRVHCAHADGISMPIEGDKLYGHPSGGRLMLHAEYIRFSHPDTGEPMQFESPIW